MLHTPVFSTPPESVSHDHESDHDYFNPDCVDLTIDEPPPVKTDEEMTFSEEEFLNSILNTEDPVAHNESQDSIPVPEMLQQQQEETQDMEQDDEEFVGITQPNNVLLVDTVEPSEPVRRADSPPMDIELARLKNPADPAIFNRTDFNQARKILDPTYSTTSYESDPLTSESQGGSADGTCTGMKFCTAPGHKEMGVFAHPASYTLNRYSYQLLFVMTLILSHVTQTEGVASLAFLLCPLITNQSIEAMLGHMKTKHGYKMGNVTSTTSVNKMIKILLEERQAIAGAGVIRLICPICNAATVNLVSHLIHLTAYHLSLDCDWTFCPEISCMEPLLGESLFKHHRLKHNIFTCCGTIAVKDRSRNKTNTVKAYLVHQMREHFQTVAPQTLNLELYYKLAVTGIISVIVEPVTKIMMFPPADLCNYGIPEFYSVACFLLLDVIRSYKAFYIFRVHTSLTAYTEHLLYQTHNESNNKTLILTIYRDVAILNRFALFLFNQWDLSQFKSLIMFDQECRNYGQGLRCNTCNELGPHTGSTDRCINGSKIKSRPIRDPYEILQITNFNYAAVWIIERTSPLCFNLLIPDYPVLTLSFCMQKTLHHAGYNRGKTYANNGLCGVKYNYDSLADYLTLTVTLLPKYFCSPIFVEFTPPPHAKSSHEIFDACIAFLSVLDELRKKHGTLFIILGPLPRKTTNSTEKQFEIDRKFCFVVTNILMYTAMRINMIVVPALGLLFAYPKKNHIWARLTNSRSENLISVDGKPLRELYHRTVTLVKQIILMIGDTYKTSAYNPIFAKTVNSENPESKLHFDSHKVPGFFEVEMGRIKRLIYLF